MRPCIRKSTPEVKNGKVQKKNDWTWTPNYYSHEQHDVIIDRQRPGKGYRHLLLARDIHAFIALLPDWHEFAIGLNAIVLSPGSRSADGYHVPGVVHVCAWEEDLWVDCTPDYYASHKTIFFRLGIPCAAGQDGEMLCKFTEDTGRAYQLLHILLHELGHHHDRMTTKTQKHSARGEVYAEAYALRYEAFIWERYREAFRLY